MTEHDKVRDRHDMLSVSGNDGPGGVSIESGYFERERRENLLEQGLLDLDELPGKTEKERLVWRSQGNLERCEAERVNRVMPEYPGTNKEDFMSDKRQVETKFMDFRKINSIDLVGKFRVQLLRASESGITYTKFMSADDQDKFILVGARKDGKGTWATTSIKELWADEQKQEATQLKM